jgi:predicted transcriptional regulator
MKLFAIIVTANYSLRMVNEPQGMARIPPRVAELHAPERVADQTQCLAVILSANYSPGMVNETQITVRVPQEIAKELDALARLMAKSDRYKAIGLSKTAVYRLALARGVQVLRQELEADRGK